MSINYQLKSLTFLETKMNQFIRSFVGSLLLCGLSVSLALAQAGTTMYVSGRHLYSAVGEKVMFRGVNEMFIWSGDKQGKTILPEIEKSGANVVRLPSLIRSSKTASKTK
jgi:hypothetical protein